jgi:hypothetical protein
MVLDASVVLASVSFFSSVVVVVVLLFGCSVADFAASSAGF